MPTTTITNTIKDLNGTAMAGIEVQIDLIPGNAFKIDTAQELATQERVLTDVNGVWTCVLEETLNITPAGSYYRVTERIPKQSGGQKVWYFVVPAADSSLFANLVSTPNTSGFIVPFVVTSSTRPAAPFVGQMIFETDTGKSLFYYGTTLGWRPNWGLPWGEIGYVDITANVATSSASYVDITGLTIAFTAVNGRRYVGELNAEADVTVANGLLMVALCDSANVVRNERGSKYNTTAWTAPIPLVARSSGTDSGSTTFKGRFNISAGATVNIVASATKRALILVRDVGPAANPVIT